MDAAVAGRGIGPNAITRVAEALARRFGADEARRLFDRAGLAAHWLRPPTQLVDEDEVRRLHQAMRDELGVRDAAAVAREAGAATARYLLGHRIPRPFQRLLRMLPARLAGRLLLAAIGRHAWTFVGSGRFAAGAVARPAPLGRGAGAWSVTITDNPLCRGLRSERPACDFYVACFEQLFRALVHPKSRVREVQCEACGDPACELVIEAPVI